MNVSNKFSTNDKSLRAITTYQVGAIESAAHRALRQHKDGLLKEYGITGMDWYVIGMVADHGAEGIRTTDLAAQLGTTMGFLTKTVNLLEAKNILHRAANAKDARSHYIIINKTYIKTVAEIEQALRARLRDTIYSVVTPEELAIYVAVMEKFSKLA